MITYIKKAFLYHWNLLITGAGIAFGCLSAYPDVIIPIMLAVEVAYLTILSTNSSFQHYVDDSLLSLKKAAGGSPEASKTEMILKSLGDGDRQKFNQITTLCLELHRLANHQQVDQEHLPESIATLQIEGINRLLWIYLKLLYSKNALETFFKTISKEAIETKIEESEKRLAAMAPEPDDNPQDADRRAALKDTLETSRARLANYAAAVSNYEFIELELERLHTKIAGLAEMSINRQDPRKIISEIDLASSSVMQTEAAINDLETYTDIPLGDLEPPDFFERPGWEKD